MNTLTATTAYGTARHKPACDAAYALAFPQQEAAGIMEIMENGNGMGMASTGTDAYTASIRHTDVRQPVDAA